MVTTPRTEEYWYNQKGKLYSIWLIQPSPLTQIHCLRLNQGAMGLLATTEGESGMGKRTKHVKLKLCKSANLLIIITRN